jgi:hypothetical protein
MAAIFSSTLAEQLGARGATESIRGQMQQSEMGRREAIQQNAKATEMDRKERMMERLGLQMQIAEKKMQAAEKMGDIDAYYNHLKTTIALDAKKASIEADNAKQLEMLKQRGDLSVVGAKAAQQEKEAAGDRPTQVQREISRVEGQFEALGKQAGVLESAKEGGLPLTHTGGSSVIRYTKYGEAKARNLAESTVRNSVLPEAQGIGLDRFADTLRDKETGEILVDRNRIEADPNYIRWAKLVMEVFAGDAVAARAYMNSKITPVAEPQ